jgi:hypothetical protein
LSQLSAAFTASGDVVTSAQHPRAQHADFTTTFADASQHDALASEPSCCDWQQGDFTGSCCCWTHAVCDPEQPPNQSVYSYTA